MKIIFFGSDDFAEIHLRALIESGRDVVGCVTQPDRAKGRGMKVVSSPIKELSVEQNIPVLQPARLKDEAFLEQLRQLEADLFVVIAYGRLLPEDVLKIPKLFAINVHPSLLPKYRGGAPINWAVINGDVISGISIIKLNTAMDAGEILVQKVVAIDDADTSATLRSKMARAGPSLLTETVEALAGEGAGSFKPVVQEEKKVTLAPKLTKEMGRIKWERGAVALHNLVRGLLPWPAAYTFYNGKQLKILSAQPVKEKGEPGKVISTGQDGFLVGTGDGSLLIKKVHLEASRAMDASEFLKGHNLKEGHRFE